MQEFAKSNQQGNQGNNNWVNLVQLGLRTIALGTSIAASCLTFTDKQSTLVYGVPMDAKWSYMMAFKFFAYATAVTSGFALLSLILTFLMRWKGTSKGNLHFLFFLHDLVITILLIGSCAGASAIGYIGKYGNDPAGWVAICDQFKTFCNRASLAILLGFISFVCFLILTIISAIKSGRHDHAAGQVQDV